MSKKKLIALILAAAMTATMLAGCSGKNEADTTGNDSKAGNQTSQGTGKDTEDQSDSNFNDPGVLPIVKEPVTITIFAPANGEYSWLDNAQTKEMEELTNIKLEWQVAASSDNVKDKISTMFASKNMTDIILAGVGGSSRYDKASEAMFGAQGLVLPLNEYIDTVSVGYKEAFAQLEGMREYITTPDGNIYSLPNVDGSLHVQYNMKLWLNKQWLDNLKLEVVEPLQIGRAHV